MFLTLLISLLAFFSVQRVELLGSESLSADSLKEQLLDFLPTDYEGKGLRGSKCVYGGGLFLSDPKIFVAISFSVPDNVWISLSKELEKEGGVFVLRGLPNNSFSELAAKLLSLKKSGVNAAIQLNPIFFQTHQITNVPAFIVKAGDEFNKISGNISLKSALEKMLLKGLKND